MRDCARFAGQPRSASDRSSLPIQPTTVPRIPYKGAMARARWGYPTDAEERHVARICRSGHIVSMLADRESAPTPFCARCGAQTLTECTACKGPIPGQTPGIVDFDPPVPAFCVNCGAAYPWTGEQLMAARELAAMEAGMTPAEREQLNTDLAAIVRDTPATAVAASRLRRIWRSLSAPIQRIATDLATEAAKQVLFHR
jgi:hypothetical protein